MQEGERAYLERVATLLLLNTGATASTVLSFPYVSANDRMRAFYADTYVYTLKCVARGDRVAALRGLLMIKEYRGRLGGLAPTSSLSDGESSISHYIQESL